MIVLHARARSPAVESDCGYCQYCGDLRKAKRDRGARARLQIRIRPLSAGAEQPGDPVIDTLKPAPPRAAHKRRGRRAQRLNEAVARNAGFMGKRHSERRPKRLGHRTGHILRVIAAGAQQRPRHDVGDRFFEPVGGAQLFIQRADTLFSLRQPPHFRCEQESLQRP